MRVNLAPRRHRTATDERGAVAIVVALSMVMLLVAAAMVLDFGVVRVDRQRAKATADSAVMAGMRAADGKTGDVYSFRAVCAALSFLRANDDRMSGLPDGICASPDNTAKCSSATPTANPAVYDHSITNAGTT
ncbi:MAG: TadE/TadG family type IV pilus assembly protein, partial [Nocardioides sp.]